MTNPPSSRPATASRRRGARAAAVALGCWAVLPGLSAGPVGAAPTPAPTPPTASTVPVMVVLDASGSMTTPDAPGRRIDAAKRAVLSLVAGLPSTARLGLEVYGAGTSSAAADKAAGCRDIDVVAPVAPLARTAVTNAVRAVRARGYTPIGAALSRAVAALPRGAPGSIVLVSDGIDTCAPPDPCAVAARLKATHRDLVVHTIGFRADRTARGQLACIAHATGGTHRDVADGATLGPVLRSRVDAGLRPYLVRGTPVVGTATAAGAPALGVGQYTDTVPRGPATTRYYSIELTAPATVHVSTTVVPPPRRGGGTDRLTLVQRLLDPAGHRCLSTERADDAVLAGKVDPVTVVLSGVVGGPSWSKRCPTQGRFVVQVTRDSASDTPTRTETIVGLEAPVAGSPGPVTAIPPAPAPVVARASTSSCAGGASFDTAPLLARGSCADTISTGETRYYRVHLGWGQRLRYRVVVDRVPGAGHGTGVVRTAVATPLRERVQLASTSNAERDFGGPAAIALTGATLVPVAYGNRDAARSDVRPYAAAGDFSLSVGLSYPVDAVPYATGVHVTVDVVGRAVAGPRYLALPTAGPGPSTAPAATANATSRARPGEKGATDGDHLSLWVCVGSLVIGAAGAAVAVSVRRRRAGRLDSTPRES